MLHLKGLEMWHGVLAATVGNKSFLAAWLVSLSMAMGVVGDKVFIDRTAEIATMNNKLDNIQRTLDRMDVTLNENGALMRELLIEQARVKTELNAHERGILDTHKGK